MTEAGRHSTANAELSDDGSTLTVSVPLTLRRRGGRKRIITPLKRTGLETATPADRRHAGEGAGAGLPLEAAA